MKLPGIQGFIQRISRFMPRLLHMNRPMWTPCGNLAEISSDLIIRFNAEKKLIYANPAYCVFAGKSPLELTGFDCRHIGLPQPIAELLRHHVADTLLTETGHRFEASFTDPSGSRFFEIQVMPEPDAQGRVAAVICVQREITALKNLEKKHGELELQYRTLLDGVAERVWIKDRSGRYLAVNRQFASQTPHSPDELVGMTARDILPPDLADLCETEDKIAMEQNRTVHIERYSTLDRTRTWRETIKVPLCNSSGRVIGLICTSRDMSQRKLAQERLEASERRLQLALHAARSGVWEWWPGALESY